MTHFLRCSRTQVTPQSWCGQTDLSEGDYLPLFLFCQGSPLFHQTLPVLNTLNATLLSADQAQRNHSSLASLLPSSPHRGAWPRPADRLRGYCDWKGLLFQRVWLLFPTVYLEDGRYWDRRRSHGTWVLAYILHLILRLSYLLRIQIVYHRSWSSSDQISA